MADEARSGRSAALEAKKRRLQELKERRNQRAQSHHATPHISPHKPLASPVKDGGRPTSSGGDLDDYINGLLSNPVPVKNTVVEKVEVAATVAPATPQKLVAAVNVHDYGESVVPAATNAPSRPQVEMYTISTQTLEEEFPPPMVEETESTPSEEDTKEDETEVEEMKEDAMEVPELTKEERDSTLTSTPFSSFFTSASKKMERLLGSRADALEELLIDADYSHEHDDEEATKSLQKRGSAAKGLLTKSGTSVVFQCGNWTKGRILSDVEWSGTHKELLVTSYQMPKSCMGSDAMGTGGDRASVTSDSAATAAAVAAKKAPSSSLIPRVGELQADGLALVWNLAMPNRPEYIFTAPSPVLVSRFHPTEPHLVMGGCASGQIVLWDLRSGGRLPVQRSSLSVAAGKSEGEGGPLRGHSHPIVGMEVSDSGSALVTAASDGRINLWSLSQLRDPAESFTIPGNISSLAIAPLSNSFVCGDESGDVFTVLPQSSGSAQSHARGGGSRRTVRKFETSKQSNASGAGGNNGGGEGAVAGHFGVVTAVATKHHKKGMLGNHAMSRGFLRGSAGLVLTCGVDWTTKLWAPAYTDQPLISFLSSSYDYMCDVQWSPTNPTVFATASSNGTLGLWNLATSLDEPLSGSDGIPLESSTNESASTSSTSLGPTPRNYALNKIRWSEDGKRLAVASGDELHIVGVTEDVSKGKSEDEGRMMSNLTARGFLGD